MSISGRLACAAVAALLAACGSAATATTTPVTALAVGATAYHDDFADAHSGWPVETRTDHVLGYVDHRGPAYRIAATSPGSSVLVLSPVSSLPAALQVTAAVTVTGPGDVGTDGDAGVGCAFDGVSYVVVIQGAGGYVINRYATDGTATTLASSDPSSTAVLASPAANRITVTCIDHGGTVLVGATVNGSVVATVADTTGAPSPRAVQVALRGDANLGEADIYVAALRAVVVAPGSLVAPSASPSAAASAAA